MSRKLRAIAVVGLCAIAAGVLARKTEKPAATSQGANTPATTADGAPISDVAREEARKAALAKAAAGARVSAPYIPEHQPIDKVRLDSFDGEKGGFANVLIVTVKITNTNTFEVKDPVIECEVGGNSGTRLGRALQTIYETIPAGKTRTFRKLNFGLTNMQAGRIGCKLRGVSR